MKRTARATPEATAAWAEANPQLAHNRLDDSGLLVSQAGFGGYRVADGVELHRQALRDALLGGVNLVDTSANYGDGDSEKLVGSVLAELDGDSELSREAVVVVTKAGYLQGQNYILSQQRKQAGNPYPDLVEYGRGLEHCLHPTFLADQLGRSLERLGLQAVDVFLLHNPEYYLGWAHQAGVAVEQARQEYYRRIRLAFEYLEEQVDAGRIQLYGVSSNTFPYPAGNAEFTSLDALWQIAGAVRADHHFRVVQFPLNLLETGAATEPNQPGGRTVLQLARDLGLAVLINRPLNAIRGNSMVRLADVPPASPLPPAELASLVEALVAAEEQFRGQILPSLKLDRSLRPQLAEFVGAGAVLQWRWQGFGGYHNWREVEQQHLAPRLRGAIHFLAGRPNLPQEAVEWLKRYEDTANIVFTAVGAFYAAADAGRTATIREAVLAASQPWAAAGSLSGMALRALRTTAGVTTVLVGMRRPEYVADVLAELVTPAPAAGHEASWQVLSRAT